MIYLISDTHFGHKNIIRYCDRPFKDVNEMDAAMIEKWNSVVKGSDTVIHVGDFAFLNDKRQKEVLAQLNGKKILVRGNHDFQAEIMLANGFDFVVESMVIANQGTRYLLSHYPIDPDNARQSILNEIGAAAHIHGHVHNKTGVYYAQRSINVSCENLDYVPRTIPELISMHRK